MRKKETRGGKRKGAGRKTREYYGLPEMDTISFKIEKPLKKDLQAKYGRGLNRIFIDLMQKLLSDSQ